MTKLKLRYHGLFIDFYPKKEVYWHSELQNHCNKDKGDLALDVSNISSIKENRNHKKKGQLAILSRR